MKKQRPVKKYQQGGQGNFVKDPLQSYLQQLPQYLGQILEQPPVQFDPTGNQAGNNWAQMQQPQQYSNPHQVFAPQNIEAPNTLQNAINQKKSNEVVELGEKRKSKIDWGKPNVPMIKALGALNVGVRAFAEKHMNDQQDEYMRSVLNNPYMGQIQSTNGMSDNVRFGYKNYQEGGEVDPLDELFEEYMNETDPAEINRIEPPTESQVDQAMIEQNQAALRKQMGRDIVNSPSAVGMDQRVSTRRKSDSQYSQFANPEFTSAASAPAAPLPTNDAAKVGFQHYLSKGLPEHVAAGIIGNLMQESGLNTHIKGDAGKATGVAQWHPDRFKGLTNWAGKQGRNPYELTTQLDYILEEPGEGQKALRKLLQTSTPEEAAHVFSNTYERPNKKYAANDKRAGYARSLISQYAKGGTYYVDENDLIGLQHSGVKYKIIHE